MDWIDMTEQEFLLHPKCDEYTKKWFRGRPFCVKNAVRQFPPWECYRLKSTKNRGHYATFRYSQEIPSNEITYTLVHGADSYVAGIAVFGIKADDIVLCGCGKLEAATEAQIGNGEKMIAARRLFLVLLNRLGWRSVRGNGKPCTKCQEPVEGTQVRHPRTRRHLHVESAMQVAEVAGLFGHGRGYHGH